MSNEQAIVESGTENSALTEHHHNDTFTYMGMTMTMVGGIYTFIFGILAALTFFEVLWAEIVPDGLGLIKVGVLVLASLAKAYLVVSFYMHLRTDNPLFRVVLLMPTIIVLLSVLYLIGVPPKGYN